MSKSIKQKIWTMHYEGYSTREIADALDISEYMVIQVLRPNGF